MRGAPPRPREYEAFFNVPVSLCGDMIVYPASMLTQSAEQYEYPHTTGLATYI